MRCPKLSDIDDDGIYDIKVACAFHGWKHVRSYIRNAKAGKVPMYATVGRNKLLTGKQIKSTYQHAM